MQMIKDAPLNPLQISRETGRSESAEPLDLGQRVSGLRSIGQQILTLCFLLFVFED